MAGNEVDNASTQDHPEPQVTLDGERALAAGRLLMSVLTEEELDELRTQLIGKKAQGDSHNGKGSQIDCGGDHQS